MLFKQKKPAIAGFFLESLVATDDSYISEQINLSL